MVINTVRIHISCILYALLMDPPYLTKNKDQLSEAIRTIVQLVSKIWKEIWDVISEAPDRTTTMMVASVHQKSIRNKDHLVPLDIKDYDRLV